MEENLRIPIDHDQRFKALIREFFDLFLPLFFENLARRVDLTSIEWLDSEQFPDPPEGTRHILDLVARLKTVKSEGEADPEDGGDHLALISIEVESSDKTTLIKPRLPFYTMHLIQRHKLRVVPIVIYLQVGLNGIGVDSYSIHSWDLEVLKFQYHYVGLPKLDGETYIHGDNLLGVALGSLMKLRQDQVSSLGEQALRKIRASEVNDQQQYLLSNLVEAYLPVKSDEFDRIAGIIEREFPGGLTQMHRNKTRYDQVYEDGDSKGQQKGKTRMVNAFAKILTGRFGQLSPETLDRLRAMSFDELDQISEMLLKANSLEELGL